MSIKTFLPRLAVPFAFIVCFSSGCGQIPRASISDPLVFTAVEIHHANEKFDTKVQLDEALNRYFFKDDSEELPIDGLLNNSQRVSGYVEHVMTIARLRVVASLLKSGEITLNENDQDPPSTQPSNENEANTGGMAATQPSNSKPASAKCINSVLDTLTEELTDGLVSDSPFDQIDRVTDFYTAYLLKYLRRMPDARAMATMNGNRQGSWIGPLKNSKDFHYPEYRRILLVFQTHVDPGTREDYMTGVRVEITGATEETDICCDDETDSGTSVCPDNIKIQRVHPTRPYDLHPSAIRRTMKEVVDLSGEIVAPLEIGQAGASGGFQQDRNTAEQLAFISRLNKQASYVDASQNSFGWNFYPTNSKIIRRNLLEWILSGIYGQPSSYRVTTFLDGGGRDAAVFLLVPIDTASITFRVTHLHARLRSTKQLPGKMEQEKGGEFTVDLPDCDKREFQVLSDDDVANEATEQVRATKDESEDEAGES